MQSLGHAESRGLLSLFSSLSQMMWDLSCSVLDARALEDAELYFGTVLGDMSRSATKEAKVVVKMALLLLWSQFTCLSQVSKKGCDSGFFWSEVEPLEPELFFCLECEEPFPDLDLTWMSQIGVRIGSGRSRSAISWEISMQHSQ